MNLFLEVNFPKSVVSVPKRNKGTNKTLTGKLSQQGGLIGEDWESVRFIFKLALGGIKIDTLEYKFVNL